MSAYGDITVNVDKYQSIYKFIIQVCLKDFKATTSHDKKIIQHIDLFSFSYSINIMVLF